MLVPQPVDRPLRVGDGSAGNDQLRVPLSGEAAANSATEVPAAADDYDAFQIRPGNREFNSPTTLV
jgi:hypothetical protein